MMNETVMAISAAIILMVILMGWVMLSYHRYFVWRRQLIQEMTELDRIRQQWFSQWCQHLPPSHPIADKVRAAHASVMAASVNASTDWSWASSLSALRNMEWKFERAMDNWLYATKDPSLSALWSSEHDKWMARRAQSNQVVEQYNNVVMSPMCHLLARLHHWGDVPMWISEQEHRRIQQVISPEI